MLTRKRQQCQNLLEFAEALEYLGSTPLIIDLSFQHGLLVPRCALKMRITSYPSKIFL